MPTLAFGTLLRSPKVTFRGSLTVFRCIGTTVGEKVLEIDYPLAFGDAFSKTIPEHKKTFRYVHLSGGMTERSGEVSVVHGKYAENKGSETISIHSYW